MIRQFYTMFPLYRIGFYNVVKIIRLNGNKTRPKCHITLGVSINFQ